MCCVLHFLSACPCCVKCPCLCFFASIHAVELRSISQQKWECRTNIWDMFLILMHDLLMRKTFYKRNEYPLSVLTMILLYSVMFSIFVFTWNFLMAIMEVPFFKVIDHVFTWSPLDVCMVLSNASCLQ